MNLFCRLTSLLLFSAFTVLASASPLDFKANILDPPAPDAPSFPTFIITASPFEVIFSGCVAGELPNGLTADGCFAGVNRTGLNWTSLELVFPNDAVLNSQPVDCSLAPSDNIFFSPSCGFDAQDYTLTYTNGVLGNNDFFFITETGVPAELFPHGTATVLSITATPEPASLLLIATGLGAVLFTGKLNRW